MKANLKLLGLAVVVGVPRRNRNFFLNIQRFLTLFSSGITIIEEKASWNYEIFLYSNAVRKKVQVIFSACSWIITILAKLLKRQSNKVEGYCSVNSKFLLIKEFIANTS